MHRVHATAFCVLLGSGLCLYLPSLAEAVNRRPLLKEIHLYTAASWAVALLLIFVFGNRRSLLRTVREVDRPRPQRAHDRGQQLNTITTAAFAILFASPASCSGTASATRASASRARVLGARLADVRVVRALPRASLLRADSAVDSPFALGDDARARWVREDWAARRHPRLGGGNSLRRLGHFDASLHARRGMAGDAAGCSIGACLLERDLHCRRSTRRSQGRSLACARGRRRRDSPARTGGPIAGLDR